MNFIELFNAGGPLMWPLAIASLLTLALIVDRAINLRASRILHPTVVERITGLLEGGRVDRAIEVCREHPGLFPSIVLAGLELVGKGEAAVKEAVENAGRHESSRLHRYLGAMATIAAVTPLMGLLGTVLGMIDVFQTIADQGAGQAASLSSGISQALITTASGLVVAIPALIAHNYFQEKADFLVGELERESLRMLRGLFGSERNSPSESPPAPSMAISGD
ncbi:MAG: MotA/TolQ/ExbB proton channel family protein [Acidobacteriota bacterium]|nr:MotA/TolQ/ExbB proton channel family protein [Acidobacteriota bacterium]MDH3784888.1 MotA/TolQ/ExbB proton channel family protein [Acidobacteriota bacterium]